MPEDLRIAKYVAIILERDAELEALQKTLENEHLQRIAAEGALRRLGALK